MLKIIGLFCIIYFGWYLLNRRGGLLDLLRQHGILHTDKRTDGQSKNTKYHNKEKKKKSDILNEGDAEYIDFEEIKDDKK